MDERPKLWKEIDIQDVRILEVSFKFILLFLEICFVYCTAVDVYQWYFIFLGGPDVDIKFMVNFLN